MKSKLKNVKTNNKVVTSKDDAEIKKANDERKEKKPSTNDVPASSSTKERYVRSKSSIVGPVVTIGGKRSTYKISNNFSRN